MPVKVDPLIVEELAAMDLVLWSATHPKRYMLNEKTGKMSLREDKGWCLVSLAGPGVERECNAGAATLRQAVDAALQAFFRDRVTGVKGALLRLGKALHELEGKVRWDRLMLEHEYSGDPDDFVPF